MLCFSSKQRLRFFYHLWFQSLGICEKYHLLWSHEGFQYSCTAYCIFRSWEESAQLHIWSPKDICKALPYMVVPIKFLLWLVLQNHFFLNYLCTLPWSRLFIWLPFNKRESMDLFGCFLPHLRYLENSWEQQNSASSLFCHFLWARACLQLDWYQWDFSVHWPQSQLQLQLQKWDLKWVNPQRHLD